MNTYYLSPMPARTCFMQEGTAQKGWKSRQVAQRRELFEVENLKMTSNVVV